MQIRAGSYKDSLVNTGPAMAINSRWDAGQVLHNPPDVIAIVNVAFWRRGKGDDWESFLVPATFGRQNGGVGFISPRQHRIHTGKVGQLEGEEVQNLRSSGGVVRRCCREGEGWGGRRRQA